MLPFKKTRDRSVGDVVGFLRDFIDGRGGEWDWDDFTSVPITDPTLEAIRAEADLISLPIDQVDGANWQSFSRRRKNWNGRTNTKNAASPLLGWRKLDRLGPLPSRERSRARRG